MTTSLTDIIEAPKKLYPYQGDTSFRATENLFARKATLVTLPTAAGKTVVAMDIWRRLGEPHAIVISGSLEIMKRWHGLGIKSVTWQSIKNPKHYLRKYRLIIWDEAHHTVAKVLRNLREAAPKNCMHLGLTATPYRGDGKPLGSLWAVLVAGPQTAELQRSKHLASTDYIVGIEPKLADVLIRNGDYDRKQLSAAMARYENTLLGDPVASWKERAGDKRTVAFCVTIMHANSLAKRFRQAGVTAEMVCGMHSSAERARIFSAFRSGEIKILATVAIISEGWDMPECECILMLRPTRSRVLWRQTIGRGLRRDVNRPGKRCLLLDHAALIGAHGLVEDREEFTLHSTVKVTEKADDSHVVYEQEDKRGQSRRLKLVPARMIKLKSKNLLLQQKQAEEDRYLYLSRGRWRVIITLNGKTKHCGSFIDKEDAKAWREHNIGRIAQGLPPEGNRKPGAYLTQTKHGRWRSSVAVPGKEPQYCGSFATKEEALDWQEHNRKRVAKGLPVEPKKYIIERNGSVFMEKRSKAWVGRVAVNKKTYRGSFSSYASAKTWLRESLENIKRGVTPVKPGRQYTYKSFLSTSCRKESDLQVIYPISISKTESPVVLGTFRKAEAIRIAKKVLRRHEKGLPRLEYLGARQQRAEERKDRYLTKQNGYWVVQLRVNGKPKYCGPSTTKTEARAWRDYNLKRLAEGLPLETKKLVTLENRKDLYLHYDNTREAWVVRVYFKSKQSRQICCGAFKLKEEARAWRDHNLKRLAEGLPPERKKVEARGSLLRAKKSNSWHGTVSVKGKAYRANFSSEQIGRKWLQESLERRESGLPPVTPEKRKKEAKS